MEPFDTCTGCKHAIFQNMKHLSRRWVALLLLQFCKSCNLFSAFWVICQICTCTLFRSRLLFFDLGLTAHSISTASRIMGLQRFGRGPTASSMTVRACYEGIISAYHPLLVYLGSFNLFLRVRILFSRGRIHSWHILESDNFDCGDWLLYVMVCPRGGSGRGIVHGRVSWLHPVYIRYFWQTSDLYPHRNIGGRNLTRRRCEGGHQGAKRGTEI